MTQTFLKTGFYMIAGTLLASISWGSIEHSVVTGDRVLAVFVMGMMFFIIGKFFVDQWRPVYGPDAFRPGKLWKIPQTAPRRELWYRVGFSTFVGTTTFTIISAVLVLTTTDEPPFMILLGSLLALRIPYLYWSMRSRYEPITIERQNCQGRRHFGACRDRGLRFDAGRSSHFGGNPCSHAAAESKATPIAPTATPDSSPTPDTTATPAPTPIPTATPVEGPGYGGHFLDPEDDSIVYVYLVNPSPEAVRDVTSTYLAPVVYEGIRKIREVRHLPANYTFRQLQRFYDRLRDSGVWDIPELTMSDVDEGINQIEYGIDCEHNRDRVQQQIHDLLSRENIPVDAVRVTVQGRARFPESPARFECAPPEVIDPVTGVSSPGFGGLFRSSGTLNVYMLEPSQRGAESLALAVVGRDILEHRHRGPSEIRAVQGQYIWKQLLEWYETITGSGIAIQGVYPYDVWPDPT